MIGSVPLPSSSSVLFEAIDLPCSKSSRGVSTICSCSRSDAYIPKLEPFSRSKIDRGVKEPCIIQKAENELSDYCSTLEGDDSYKCWRSYFDLKDLEREMSKEDVEKLIIQSGGVKSLIDCVHGISVIHSEKNKKNESLKPPNGEKQREKPFPIPDGLPKTHQEMEEEEKARMLDSPYTRLLRSKGKFPAWYSPAPDHETD